MFLPVPRFIALGSCRDPVEGSSKTLCEIKELIFKNILQNFFIIRSYLVRFGAVYFRYLIYIVGIFSQLNAAAFCWVFRHKVGCKIFMNACLLVLLPMAFVVVLIPAALRMLFVFLVFGFVFSFKNGAWNQEFYLVCSDIITSFLLSLIVQFKFCVLASWDDLCVKSIGLCNSRWRK